MSLTSLQAVSITVPPPLASPPPPPALSAPASNTGIIVGSVLGALLGVTLIVILAAAAVIGVRRRRSPLSSPWWTLLAFAGRPWAGGGSPASAERPFTSAKSEASSWAWEGATPPAPGGAADGGGPGLCAPPPEVLSFLSGDTEEDEDASPNRVAQRALSRHQAAAAGAWLAQHEQGVWAAVPWADLRIQKQIGEGSFGQVRGGVEVGGKEGMGGVRACVCVYVRVVLHVTRRLCCQQRACVANSSPPETINLRSPDWISLSTSNSLSIENAAHIASTL